MGILFVEIGKLAVDADFPANNDNSKDNMTKDDDDFPVTVAIAVLVVLVVMIMVLVCIVILCCCYIISRSNKYEYCVNT